MAYLGTIIGQLTFGFFVDRYGRKYGAFARATFARATIASRTRADGRERTCHAGMLAASVIMIVGSALCAGAYGAGGSIQGMFSALIVYRLITGVGSELCLHSFRQLAKLALPQLELH